jgi:putative PIN family toxin of toxin-antitoxin system
MGKVEVNPVVIDTNVVVSALLFAGVPGRLISLWQSGAIRPHASKEMIDEYIRVLAYPKFELSEQEINLLLYHEILPHFEIIEVIQGEPLIKNDPSDDKFIWCAKVSGANIVISGDRHLLRIKEFGKTRILTPAQFLRNLPNA